MSESEEELENTDDVDEDIAHNEPICYELEDEDGTQWVIYRISSTGRCLLELVAARTGWPPAPPPPFLADAFARGHKAEKAILDRYMKEYGVGIDKRQAQVEFMISPGIKLRGHIDGVNIGTGNVIDAKFYRSDTVDQIVRDPEKYMPKGYLWQAAGYGAALGANGVGVGMELVFGRHDPKSDVLTGIEVVEYTWDELKSYLAKIRVKVLKAERIAREDLEWPLCEDGKIYPCPYHELRVGRGGKIEAKTNAKGASDTRAFDSSDTAGLAQTLWKERQEQNQVEKNAKAGKDELNKRILYLIEQQEGGLPDTTQTWDIGGEKVLLVVKETNLYDWKKVYAEIPDFDKKYKLPGTKTRYLQVGRGEL